MVWASQGHHHCATVYEQERGETYGDAGMHSLAAAVSLRQVRWKGQREVFLGG